MDMKFGIEFLCEKKFDRYARTFDQSESSIPESSVTNLKPMRR